MNWLLIIIAVFGTVALGDLVCKFADWITRRKNAKRIENAIRKLAH